MKFFHFSIYIVLPIILVNRKKMCLTIKDVIWQSKFSCISFNRQYLFTPKQKKTKKTKKYLNEIMADKQE